MEQKCISEPNIVEIRGIVVDLNNLSKMQSPILRRSIQRIFLSRSPYTNYKEEDHHHEHLRYKDGSDPPIYHDSNEHRDKYYEDYQDKGKYRDYSDWNEYHEKWKEYTEYRDSSMTLDHSENGKSIKIIMMPSALRKQEQKTPENEQR